MSEAASGDFPTPEAALFSPNRYPNQTHRETIQTMRLFSREPEVPNTISDAQMANLSRRAQRASTESMFSKRNVARRIASNEQQQKRKLS